MPISEDEKVVKAIISDAASALGKTGGLAGLKKYGKARYVHMGKLGAAARWKNHIKSESKKTGGE